MTTPSVRPSRLRVAHLNSRQATEFDLRPDTEARAVIADGLGIDGVAGLSFKGNLTAGPNDSWELRAKLHARVIQPCVVTLAPVKTDLTADVMRVYSPHLRTPEGDEVEMPDETLESLGQFIDLEAVMIEELALALPEYPRAKGAELMPQSPDDTSTPDTRRPFQGLDLLLKRDGDPTS